MSYGGSTACAVAGITFRQLDYWRRTDLVVPSGTGGQYEFRDIVALKVVRRLLDAGVSLQNVRRAIATLRLRGEHDLASLTLVSDGHTVYECRSADEIFDLLQGGQGVFAIAVAGAFRETQGTLAAFPAGQPERDELAAARARRRKAV